MRVGSRSADPRSFGIDVMVRSVVPSQDDVNAVRTLLGRPPKCSFAVVVRDAEGAPAVIANAAVAADGTPMPTRYWLLDPELRVAVAALESRGGVREAEAAVPPELLAAAHARYARERDRLVPPDYRGPVPRGGVGGTRQGVKCLHAHLAWWLVGGNDPVGGWVVEHLEPRLRARAHQLRDRGS